MASLSEIEQQRAALANLITLAQRDLVGFWRALDYSNADAVSAALREVLPDLMSTYGSAAGTLGADFYDELRDAAGVKLGFLAEPVETPPIERTDALARWATSPLFSETQRPDLALTLLAGGVQRLIADMQRDTVALAAEADPAGARYARHASANACAFCAMLATRDAVYTSERSALTVGGRGTEVVAATGRGATGGRAKGTRVRGSQGIGSKYHDHCHCTVVPVWAGQQIERAPYVDRWTDAYLEATARSKTKGENGAIDVTQTLAAMRQSLATS